MPFGNVILLKQNHRGDVGIAPYKRTINRNLNDYGHFAFCILHFALKSPLYKRKFLLYDMANRVGDLA